MRKKDVCFCLDSLEWQGGVSDEFDKTPLGQLSKPLDIEQIAEVEWTIVYDNFITVFPIDPDTQLKFWLKLPEKAKNKIKKYSEEIFPFDKTRVVDRYLLAYTVEGLNDKYIGFTFESMLEQSKVCVYVYMQARVVCEEPVKEYLIDYLNEIDELNINDIVAAPEAKKKGITGKLKELFKFG